MTAMNARQTALAALKALRADDAKLPDTHDPRSTVAVWDALAQEFPNGDDIASGVTRMLGKIVSTIERALPEPFAVRIDRDNSVVVGLIVCPSATNTTIIPLSVREAVVTLAGSPIFVGRAKGRDALRLALIGTVVDHLQAGFV